MMLAVNAVNLPANRTVASFPLLLSRQFGPQLRNLRGSFRRRPRRWRSPRPVHAPRLITCPQVAERALTDARCAADDINALVISTSTGYLCPGLTSYVAERLALPADVFTLDLVGQGCGAALRNWRAAEGLLEGGGARRVLSVCVEVCSAATYSDDDPGVLISARVFGDGTGAAVLSREPSAHSRRVEWKTAVSVLKPAQREHLRFQQRGGLLRNVLTLEVPSMAAEAIAEILDQALTQAAVSRGEIRGWMMNAGGRDVLNALRLKLGLASAATALSCRSSEPRAAHVFYRIEP